MKRLIFSALVLSAVTANAQVKDGMVGINTDEPRATMHIEPGVSESKGLIIPRITAAQMKTMTNLAHFGADHHAIITYLKETLPAADRTGKLVDVADPGYYYYDNTTGVQKWKTFGGGAEQDFKALPTSTPGLYNYLSKGAGIGGTSLGTGHSNIGIGDGGIFNFLNNSDMTGSYNIAMGAGVFQLSSGGGGTMSSQGNIGIGTVLYTFNNGGSITGYNNMGMGNDLYKFQKASAQFSGGGNTSIGQTIFHLQNGDLTGGNNIGMGNNLYSMRRGDMASSNNIALGGGIYTLDKTTGAVFTGSGNTGIGNNLFHMVDGNLTGSGNIGMGNMVYAINSGNMTGILNIGIGNTQYHLNTGNMEGEKNIGIGYDSYYVYNGDITNTASNNIALGNNIYRLTNTTTSTFSGFKNIGIGTEVYRLSAGSLTGKRNIGMGESVFSIGSGDFTGDDNIGIGNNAMQVTGGIEGKYNIALGYNGMLTGGKLTGTDNIGIGRYTMQVSGGIIGNYNIALGYQTMNTSGTGKLVGTDNIAIGSEALHPDYNTDIGSYNIGIGNRALYGGMANGNANIQIGNDDIGTTVAGQLNNVVAIGNEVNNLATYNTDSNTILLGNQSSNPNSPKVGVGTYKPQAKLDVAGAVRVADDSSACTTTNRGTIRFSGNHFYGCDGTTWKQLDN